MASIELIDEEETEHAVNGNGKHKTEDEIAFAKKQDDVKKEQRSSNESEPREAVRKVARPTWLLGKDESGKGRIPLERLAGGSEGVGVYAIVCDIRVQKDVTNGKTPAQYWKVQVTEGPVSIPFKAGKQDVGDEKVKGEFEKFDKWVTDMKAKEAKQLEKGVEFTEDVLEYQKMNITPEDFVKMRKRDPIVKVSGQKLDFTTFTVISTVPVKVGDRVKVAGCTYSIAYTSGKKSNESKSDFEPRPAGEPFVSFSARVVHEGPLPYKELSRSLRHSLITDLEIQCLKQERTGFSEDVKIRHGGENGPKYLVGRISNDDFLGLSRDKMTTWVQIYNPVNIYGEDDEIPERIQNDINNGPLAISVEVPDTRPYKPSGDHHNYICSKPKQKTELIPCIRNDSDSLSGGSLDPTKQYEYKLPIYTNLSEVFGITDVILWSYVGARLFRYTIALAALLVDVYKEDVVEGLEGDDFLSKRFFARPTLIVNMAETLKYAGVKVSKEVAFTYACLERPKRTTVADSPFFSGNPLKRVGDEMKTVPFFCLNEFAGDLEVVFGRGFDFYIVPPDKKMVQCTNEDLLHTVNSDFYEINANGKGDKYVEENWIEQYIDKKSALYAVNKNQY